MPVRLLEKRPAFMEKESLKRGINSTKDSQWKRARWSLIINLGSFVYDAYIFILIFFIDENERGEGLYITCRILRFKIEKGDERLKRVYISNISETRIGTIVWID